MGMDRYFPTELKRATEWAASAAYIKAFLEGCQDKDTLDGYAVRAMHAILTDEVKVPCEVIFGEGEWDNAPMLYPGEKLGAKTGAPVHIGADPLDGTSLTRDHLPGASSVIVAGEPGGIMALPDRVYLRKLVVGPAAKGQIDMARPFADNLKAVARALGKPVKALTVGMLARARNLELMQAATALECQVRTFGAGDIIPAIMTAFPERDETGHRRNKASYMDVFCGSGGTPEALLTAVIVRCLGGDMQARFYPEDTGLRPDDPKLAGLPTEILTLHDLVPGQDVMASITAVTDTLICPGVRYDAETDTIITHSWVFRGATGTLQKEDTFRKLQPIRKLFDSGD
jgi:fructose-1,6-bisphosphatase II